MNMQTIEMLQLLTQSTGVSGAEEQAVACAANLVKDLGETYVTPLGSLVCKVKTAGPEKPHIMLNAHIDEIGMIVTRIDKKGFLKVSRVGGIDRRMVLSSPVVVHTENGDFRGVVGSTPPHLQQGKERKNPTLDEIYLDMGFDNKEEAQANIPLGSIVSFEGPMANLKNGLVCGKAMDDRCCCVSMIQACKMLKEMDTDCSITLMLSAMEETGGEGAQTAAFGIDPTHSIVMDVTFASAPDMSKEKYPELANGPTISCGGAQDSKMFRQLLETAKEHNIPYTLEASGGNGVSGTDAAGIVNRRAGIRTAIIGLPLRNMHTPVEVISVEALDHAANLVANFVAKYIR